MSVSLQFNVGPEYPVNFPRNIVIKETDALSCSSFEESFKAAQEAYLPYYSVAVVESGNNNDESFYQVYDTAYFSRLSQEKDAITRRTIRQVHYFAIKCFEFDKELICRPVDLEKIDKISLNPFRTSHNSVINTMLLDSTNANIFETVRVAEQAQVRRTQYLIADLIKKGQLFSNLKPMEREKEVLQWLWCSAKGSYRGLVNLAQECLAHANIIPHAEKKAVQLLTDKLSAPPLKGSLTMQENVAFVDAMALLQKHLNKVK